MPSAAATLMPPLSLHDAFPISWGLNIQPASAGGSSNGSGFKELTFGRFGNLHELPSAMRWTGRVPVAYIVRDGTSAQKIEPAAGNGGHLETVDQHRHVERGAAGRTAIEEPPRGGAGDAAAGVEIAGARRLGGAGVARPATARPGEASDPDRKSTRLTS